MASGDNPQPAQGGALADADLHRLAELWPTLSQETKERIMALAEDNETRVLR